MSRVRSSTGSACAHALILHLQDVYWSDEGQLSVEAVSLAGACLGLALVGFTPFGIDGLSNVEQAVRLSATGVLIVDGALALICVLKGKYRTALFGVLIQPHHAAIPAPTLFARQCPQLLSRYATFCASGVVMNPECLPEALKGALDRPG